MNPGVVVAAILLFLLVVPFLAVTCSAAEPPNVLLTIDSMLEPLTLKTVQNAPAGYSGRKDVIVGGPGTFLLWNQFPWAAGGGGYTLPTKPDAVMFYGHQNPGYYPAIASPSTIAAALWAKPLGAQFEAGKTYDVSFDRIWAFTYNSLGTSNYYGNSKIIVSCSIVDANSDDVVSKSFVFGVGANVAATEGGPELNNAQFYYVSTSDNPSELSWSFKMPAGEGYKLVLQCQIIYMLTVNTDTTIVGLGSWVAFQGFKVSEPPPGPDPNEEFQEEQRGFWQKVLDFLKGIVDAIKAIPEMIVNFFRQIADIFKMIAEWLASVGRLLVKASKFFGFILKFLPAWMYAGSVALVAICVIYKILGRESTG